MAQVEKSAATLRIMGEDLDPAEISKLLCAQPTHRQKKGDEIVGKKTGKVRVARFGMWQIKAADREPEDIDGQIQEILKQTSNDLTVWREIGKKFEVDLFCGLFLKGSNESLIISAESLTVLGERGILIGFDIYGGSDEAD
jgi:hypothetical protein